MGTSLKTGIHVTFQTRSQPNLVYSSLYIDKLRVYRREKEKNKEAGFLGLVVTSVEELTHNYEKQLLLHDISVCTGKHVAFFCWPMHGQANS